MHRYLSRISTYLICTGTIKSLPKLKINNNRFYYFAVLFHIFVCYDVVSEFFFFFLLQIFSEELPIAYVRFIDLLIFSPTKTRT